MPDIALTYESLYEILRNEKYKKELQNLDDDFFRHITKYMEEKALMLNSQKSKDSIFASQQKAAKEIDNTKRIVKELYEIREKKLMEIARLNARSQNRIEPKMVKEEADLYNSLLTIITRFREGILDNMLEGKKPEIQESPQKPAQAQENKMIRFVHAVPKFVAEDLRTYGPYDDGDMANLPEKSAKVLVKAGRAENL